MLKQQLDKPDDEQIQLLRKKLDKENKRANSYIEEKIVFTEKLYNNVNAYLKVLDEGLQAIAATSSPTDDFQNDTGGDEFQEEYFPEERTHSSSQRHHSLGRRMHETNNNVPFPPTTHHHHHHHQQLHQEQQHHSFAAQSEPQKMTQHHESSPSLLGHQRVLKAGNQMPHYSSHSVSTSITDQLIYGSTADLQEPVYCICRQVSYGDMIGCDNSSCTVEWFHYACVGLTAPPKGKWFCPECSGKKG